MFSIFSGVSSLNHEINLRLWTDKTRLNDVDVVETFVWFVLDARTHISCNRHRNARPSLGIATMSASNAKETWVCCRVCQWTRREFISVCLYAHNLFSTLVETRMWKMQMFDMLWYEDINKTVIDDDEMTTKMKFCIEFLHTLNSSNSRWGNATENTWFSSRALKHRRMQYCFGRWSSVEIDRMHLAVADVNWSLLRKQTNGRECIRRTENPFAIAAIYYLIHFSVVETTFSCFYRRVFVSLVFLSSFFSKCSSFPNSIC